MIAVLTSNSAGGIAQFTSSLICALNRNEVQVKGYVPSETVTLSENMYRLPRVTQTDAFFRGRAFEACVSKIESGEPDSIIVTDTSLVSLAIAKELCGRMPVYIVVHDAHPHPTSSLTPKKIILECECKRLMKIVARQSLGLIFLSEYTKSQFKKVWKRRVRGAKTITIRLCAHPADCDPVMPRELESEKGNYLLFFGRIDKYKGLDRLLRVYSKSNNGLPRLVIAGAGKLRRTESELLSECANVVLINRYIADGEMNWLFSNCSAVVLPYVEASQSGVLTMAYHFGKPVVVSDLPGLTEFVEEGVTGFTFSNDDELSRSLLRVTEDDNWQSRVRLYEKTNLDWDDNVLRLLHAMGIQSGTS